MINCAVCNKPLANGTDTFGDVNDPLCQTCFFDYLDRVHEEHLLHDTDLCLADYVLRVKEEKLDD